MTVRRALLLLVVGLGACPKVVAPPAPPPSWTGSEPEQPLALAELADDLEKTIRESYQALSKGYEESYLEFLAHDQRLVLIDVGPDDVLVGFSDAAVAQTRQFPDKSQQVVSKRLEVHVSPDGTTGWSFDELSYRVLHEGRRVIIPMRATAAYERRAGRWLLVQQHVSYAIPDDEIWHHAAGGRVGTPRLLGNFTAPSTPSKEAKAVIDQLLADKSEGLVDAEALVIGSDPDGEWRGAEAAAHVTLRGLFGGHVSTKLVDVRVKGSATGQLAWAAADVRLGGTWEGQTVELPLRVTWILERAAGKAYHLVQMHVSVPVDADELSLRALGVTLI